MRTAFLILVLTLAAQVPAWAQQATDVGLKGTVHTVLTEEFTSDGGLLGGSTGSVLEIYDRKGYQLEVYHYKADGSLWVHTVIDRNGPQVTRIRTTGTAPFENHSIEYVFDSEGRVIETNTYDANGVPVSKFTNEFVQHGVNSVTISTGKSAGGQESTTEISESTDPETGITHQVETKNGKTETDWVIQRNKDGTQHDKIIYADGSYNERQSESDGTTVEDRYFAPTKSHTYQKSDAQGHLIEVTEESDSHYIRCTYSFDEQGRSTGQINYDVAGNVLEKSTAEYRDDPHGNWIEKKSIVWETRSEPMLPKIVETTLRTINYY